MYSSPDFIKVQVKVEDSFAAYDNCEINEFRMYKDESITGVQCNDIYKNFLTEASMIDSCWTGRTA